MFPHTADSIQKTFVEALSQTMFSTGEQNKSAKVECKAGCLSTSVSRSIMKVYIRNVNRGLRIYRGRCVRLSHPGERKANAAEPWRMKQDLTVGDRRKGPRLPSLAALPQPVCCGPRPAPAPVGPLPSCVTFGAVPCSRHCRAAESLPGHSQESRRRRGCRAGRMEGGAFLVAVSPLLRG